MEVTTTEGLGNQKKGYHPIQAALADKSGTQCGFCSPGFVMTMYGLLKEYPNPTPAQVERQFDGILCRCTGYRPIFEAFQTFSSADGEAKTCAGACGKKCVVTDIEDCGAQQAKCCSSSGVAASVSTSTAVVSVEGTNWFIPTSLAQLYQTMNQNLTASLVFGHTSKGVTNLFTSPDFIDLQHVPELRGNAYNARTNSLNFGASTTVQQFHRYLLDYQAGTQLSADQKLMLPDLIYAVGRVSGHQVRSAACIAGNIMLAKSIGFAADLTLALVGLGAEITIGNSNGTADEVVDLLDFVQAGGSMTGKVIKQVMVPLGLPFMVYKTYKVALRNTNAHALVNGAFMAITNNKNTITNPPIIAFGNIRKGQARMVKTEKALMNVNLTDPNTLQSVMAVLASELNADPKIPRAAYRTSVAMGFFYKFYLCLLPKNSVAPKYLSAMTRLDEMRPLSSGVQSFKPDPAEYPVSEALPKLKGHQQCSGEVLYTGDLPAPPGTLCGAFVTSTVAAATIDTIDPSAALAMPGVVAWISAKDVPGKNMTDQLVEIFASSEILYCGQAIGMIVASNQGLAFAAAAAVKVTYKNITKPVVTIADAIAAGSFWGDGLQGPAIGDIRKGFQDSNYIINGQLEMGGQYHFHQETQTALIIPHEDDQFKAYVATQMTTTVQQAIANTLTLPLHKVQVEVKRCGGGYGGKLTNSEALACALAVAANKLGCPIEGTLTIQNNMEMLGRRPKHRLNYTVGVMNNGLVHALQINTFTEAGCSNSGDNYGTVSQLLLTLDTCYSIPNFSAYGKLCKTNTASNTSARGPGWTPGVFFMEHIMEHVASFLGQEPSAIKEMNFFQKGQKTPDGTPLTYWNMDVIWPQLKASSDYATRLQAVKAFNSTNTWKKKGLSIIPVRWAAGWQGDYQCALVNVYGDGTVLVSHSGVEIGQGMDTKVAQTVAYELGIPMSSITINNQSTVTAPNGGGTGGSVTSGLCCRAAAAACKEIKQRLAPIASLLALVAQEEGTKAPPTWQELVAKALASGVCLQVTGSVFPPAGPLSPNVAYNSYSAIVQEAELDVLTGEIQLDRTDILFDCGISLNPTVDIGQVEGGFVMGLGLYLTEEINYDANGKLITFDTWEYKPEGALDIPVDFRVSLLPDAPNPLGFLSSKLSGEPPVALSCAALLAVQHAAKAFREEKGGLNVKDFFLDSPATVERAQLGCSVQITDYRLQ